MAVGSVEFGEMYAAETEFVRCYCGLAGINYPGDTVVKKALRWVADRGDLTGHDRFVPAGINLTEAFTFFYNFNESRKTSGHQIKLYHNFNSEWWQDEKDVENLSTEPGIIRCDFSTVWLPTDIHGRPFDIDYDAQVEWAKEQGGDGLASAEEVLYLVARCLLEFNRPLWGAGSARCRNCYGSDRSLSVSWFADDGLRVGYWAHRDAYWDVAALPRKFVALGS